MHTQMKLRSLAGKENVASPTVTQSQPDTDTVKFTTCNYRHTYATYIHEQQKTAK